MAKGEVWRGVKLGSVSHGTMRDQDLIPAFMDKLDEIRDGLYTGEGVGLTAQLTPEETEERKKMVARIDVLLGEIEQHQDADGLLTMESGGTGTGWVENVEAGQGYDPDSDEPGYYDEGGLSGEDLETLTDLLGELAPPYCYFGANEGDGADYGFWVS